MEYRGDGECNCGETCTSCQTDCGSCDTTPPTAEIIEPITPASGYYKGGSYGMKFRFSDSGGSGLSLCEYKIESYGNVTRSWTQISGCTGNGPIEFSPEQMTVNNGTNLCRNEGTNRCTIYLHARDGAGKETWVQKSYSIDWTPPTTEIK